MKNINDLKIAMIGAGKGGIKYPSVKTHTVEVTEPETDTINYPAHYNNGKIEVIDFIEDQQLGFTLGSVVKYVCRAGKKDPNTEIEDLSKAAWLINRQINNLKKAQNNG